MDLNMIFMMVTVNGRHLTPLISK